jgi:hypothetical protein
MMNPTMIRIGAWLVNVGPRLLSFYKRATGEDDLFQALNAVQEAKSCLVAAEMEEGRLVEDWSPDEYRREARQQLALAESRLRKLSGSY